MKRVRWVRDVCQIPTNHIVGANVQGRNGKHLALAQSGLKKISLNHDVWKGAAVDSPIDFNITDFDAFNTDTNTRRIEKGKTKTLVFEFEHDVDKDATHYSAGTARFGADDSCVIVFLP